LPSSRLVYVLVGSQAATVHPVPPGSLTFNPTGGNVLLLDVAKDKFDHSPNFQNQMPPAFSQDNQINQVYAYYNQQWQGRSSLLQAGQQGAPGALPPTGRAASANLTLATGILGQSVTIAQHG